VLYLLQNFIGLSIADGYIAYGPETNEVSFVLSFFFVYPNSYGALFSFLGV
jgi:hypothetical protein